MSDLQTVRYYVDDINLNDVAALEERFQELLNQEIKCVADLQVWLDAEHSLNCEISEAMAGHRIDFFRDTANEYTRDITIHDQTVVQAVVLQYTSALDQKFCSCPFTEQLDECKYGRMRRVRQTKLELFCEENSPLKVRERELETKYNQIMGGLMIEWEGETKPVPFVEAQLESTDRTIRECAWTALCKARRSVKPQLDEIMSELVQIRHQMALNAGFQNYRDYMFKANNREYNVQDCYDFHTSVEKHLVPVWKRLAEVFRSELGVNTYRPWDSTAKMLKGAPYSKVTELMDGLKEMLGQTDPYFVERFIHMQERALMDLEGRAGKAPNAFCLPLQVSKDAFLFANRSPSFNAIRTLIHEMGHAVNFYLQFAAGMGITEHNVRPEVMELYSHAMELLLLDKLDTFYRDASDFKNAQRESLRRSLSMLISPLSGDMFQHWMYTNPTHTSEERDSKWLEISKRFMSSPVDITGLEQEVAGSWQATIHYFQYPFYTIEYAMAQLGAIQLLALYREDPHKAITLFKRGASTDLNQSIAEIYCDTGVEFDFSEPIIRKASVLLEKIISELI